jgi:hypothetical protein
MWNGPAVLMMFCGAAPSLACMLMRKPKLKLQAGLVRKLQYSALERDDMRLNHSAGAIFHTQG